MTDEWRVLCGDAVETMRTLPEGEADLVLTDPPYNIGKADWDKIEQFTDWTRVWLCETARVARPNAVLYMFCGDIEQIADILVMMRQDTPWRLLSFCAWDKGETFRAQAWKRRCPDGDTAPRAWFPALEYCIHAVNVGSDGAWGKTGLDRIYSNPACFAPLKRWYNDECARLGMTAREIGEKYTAVTGKKPYMLRHYFQDSQFAIPTREVWNAVYKPLGFGREYEEMRREYEEMRYAHRCDEDARNLWRCGTVGSGAKERYHPTQKPVQLLRRLIRTSSRPGEVVLDPFCGSGSCGVAAMAEGRRFIGIDRDAEYCAHARKWIGAGVQMGLT